MTRRLVAILSADAVGYSRLMAVDEAAALRQVDAQRALLREAIETHGGRVVDAVGDNLLAELPSAVEAVACAVEAQRSLALRNEALPTEQRLELRIGIHVGDVIAEGDRIAGDAVNVAARIEALAPHGGVALSGAAHEQVVGKLDIAFEDLGERVLKNLARPVRVLRVAGLGRALEPSAPLAAPLHNLPEQRTRFVGRESELRELEAMLEQTRLLTLTGIGGAGKSRLSLELARRTLAKFPDGVRLAELASQSAPEQVAPALAQALGVAARGGFGELAALRPPEEELIRFVGERALLLLIDNCEHLVEAVAALVDQLLARCPRLTILATSQEPLGVSGEQVWQVPPLGEASALLFAERAAAVRADFRPAEHAAAIEEICERLDGIPLAIELAAARVAHLSPREIAARLGDRFKLLASRERSGEKRHATLRATLDWSHELLDEPERALLRRLSVFCDPFTLDATESVCAEPPLDAAFVLDLLADLVRRSLVVPREQAGETRYRLLESVRQYAGEKLAEAGETARTRDRHADWALALARRLLPLANLSFRSEVGGEVLHSISDVWAAGDWALERADVERAPELIARSAWLAFRFGRTTEMLASIERALNFPGLASAEWRLHLRLKQGVLVLGLGRFAEGFRFNESLIPELRAAGRHQMLSAALIQQAISSASTGLGDPFPLLESAIEAARAAGDPELEIDALGNLGGFQLADGRYAEAVATLDRAAALAPRGEPRFYLASLQALAAVLSGDVERAGLLARNAEPASWPSASRNPNSLPAHAAWLLASAASGDLEATAERLRDAVSFQREQRVPLVDAELLAAFGGVAALLGDPERAGRLLGAARSEFGKHGSWRTPQGGAIYVHFSAQVRRALPADVAKRARDEGRALSVEQAFELALAMLPPE